MNKKSALLTVLLVMVSAGLVIANPVDRPRLEAAKADLQIVGL